MDNGTERSASAAIERDVACPYCGETFTTVFDPSVEHQTYIEDCYVCCRPIQFTVECQEGKLLYVSADRS